MELISQQQLRIRQSRRIDFRHRIKIYDEDLAIVNMFLKKLN
jgi:hypothetical protein